MRKSLTIRKILEDILANTPDPDKHEQLLVLFEAVFEYAYLLGYNTKYGKNTISGSGVRQKEITSSIGCTTEAHGNNESKS